MKITYWTTACLEPDIEAVSKEVSDLAARFGGSRIFAFSPHLLLKLRARCFGFNTAFEPLLRLIIPLLERATDVNHVYSEVSPWLFFKTLRRKPIVLTIASEKGRLLPEFVARCEAVVVQTLEMRRRLEAVGVPTHKIHLIYPGIDLTRFIRQQNRIPTRRPSVLLATFPRSDDELGPRGVLFLLEAAKRHPHIDFHFVSRPWRSGNTALRAVQGMIAGRGLQNVRLSEGVQENMQELYATHDFTVVPYTRPDGGKECPRSLTESLACGVPVLISEAAPFSSFVAAHACGGVFRLDIDHFASAVDASLAEYTRLSENASRCAYTYFDREKSYRDYELLYDKLFQSSA